MGLMSTTQAIKTVSTYIKNFDGTTSIDESKVEIDTFTGYSRVVVTTVDAPLPGDSTTVTTEIAPFQLVDTVEVDRVFDAMITSVSDSLDTLYGADKLDAELYSKVLASMMQSTLDLATKSAQQQPTLDAQLLKTEADTSFVKTQQNELSKSVGYNNKIKALDAYSDLIGTMGAGGLTISKNMWSTEFDMIADLNTSGTFTGTPVVSKL